jgi:hypothetical protein
MRNHFHVFNFVLLSLLPSLKTFLLLFFESGKLMIEKASNPIDNTVVIRIIVLKA